MEVITKYIDTSQTYNYEIRYFHPPGEPTSASKDILTHFEIKGSVSISLVSEKNYTIDIVTLKWNNEGPAESEIIEAFNKEIINEFVEKIK